MADLSGSNVTSRVSNSTTGDETSLTIPVRVSLIFNITVNTITCPLTFLLNVLVIMAVKRRPRLQSKANILLACLAVTDALSGLVVQPAFIMWMTSKLLDMPGKSTIIAFVNSSARATFVCSSLHLMLVTFERLIAIKFTMQYPNIVTTQNIKVVVTSFWITTFSSEVTRFARDQYVFSNVLAALVLTSCVVFIAFSYVILYHETRRQEKKIKSQQLPKEEVERFAKESKALKTTVYVVGAVVLCFVPAAALLLISSLLKVSGAWMQIRLSSLYYVFTPAIRTCGLLNSLLNPLIYCWRQREMRKFVLSRFSAVHEVHPTA